MAAGEYLPPVITRLSMDLGDFAAGVAKAKAMMKGLGGDFKIGTDGIDAAATKIKALQASLKDLNGTVKVNTDGIGALAAKTTAAGAATRTATGIMINGWRLTGNAIHWIIAGGAELLAVTLPALVALGAGLAVMGQAAAENVVPHMQAVYTATEATSQMFNTTAGQVIGLGHALQQAQDAANPAVYSILGSAVITVNEHFGNLAQTGLQVAHMFQDFAAKVALDFAPGGSLGNTVNHLLANMTLDLQGLGQVFGNTGHALLNFANAMPGLAEWMLKGLAAITGFASHLAGLAGPLITIVMGFEEFNRWGGLVATTLTKLGVASAELTGGAFSFARFASVFRGLASVLPTVIGLFGKLLSAVKLTAAGSAVSGFADKMLSFIKEVPAWQAALGGLAAIGLGILIYKLATAKDSVQRFTDSLQQMTLKATNANAFQQIFSNIGQLNQRLAETHPIAVSAANDIKGLGAAISNMQATKINELNSGLKQQQEDLKNVAQGAAYLARTYHTDLVGALGLADLANVKLAQGITGTSQAAELNRMKIASLVQGYQSMGAPINTIGSDIKALAIQSGLANSQVGKLNQAWDQFMQNLTGGTGALASFTQDLTSLTSGANNVTNVLGKVKGGVTLTMQGFAASLKTFTGQGAQAWQNFDKVVGSTAPQLIDWLRTAGAEGALSGQQFTKAVLGMASALVPLASQSKTAQAEVLGLVQQVDPAIQTWGQLKAKLDSTHASLRDTTSAVQSATQKMGDMSAVAQNLSKVLQSAVLTALSTAKIAASGAGAAMQTYEQDIMGAGTAASKTAGDRAKLISDLEKLGYTAKQAAQLVQMVSGQINNLHDKTVTITVVTNSISTGGKIPVGVAAPGHAKGTPSAPSGWAWVGEAGPELVKFRGGETVLPNSVSRGFAGGAGYTPADQHIHVYLDGRQIYSAVQKQAVAAQRRTGHNGMTKRTR